MEPDPIPLSILVLALLAAGFAIGAEAALMAVSRSEVRKLSEEGDVRTRSQVRRAKVVDQLLREPAQFLLTSLLLNTLGVLSAGAVMVRLLPDTMSATTVVVIVLTAWLSLAVLQAAGRGWVRARPLAVALALAPVMRIAVVLLWPVAALVRRAGKALADEEVAHADDLGHLSEDELRRLIGATEEEEPMQESEKQMITSILEMDETVAREVMVPRMDIVTLNVETSLRAALGVIIDAGHSRIPVFEETVDHIVGFLYAKDLLKCFQEKLDNLDNLPIRSLLRPAYFVPLSKKVNVLLHEMQRDRVHIAMVVDEYGGIAGLVTIEDIIEEIVGDIQDEYDLDEEIYVQSLGSNSYLFNARFDVYSLAKLLDAELPDEDADTLGGMIYSLLGHVPTPGEAVEVGGWRFTVLTMDGRRIEEVRAELVAPTSVLDARHIDDARADETPELTANKPPQNEDVTAHDDTKPSVLTYSASD